MKLAGKAALVTGSAVRVGRAILRELASAGADVAVHYNRSREQAEASAAECRALGVRAVAVRAELADRAAVRAMVATVADQLGRLDVLVNSASVFPRTPIDAVGDADWDANLAVNVTAPWVAAQAAVPHMVRHGAGKIINIVDRAAFTPYRNYLPYIVSKTALLGLTRTLALELADRNIQVNGVAPGAVLLPEDFTESERAEIIARIPAGRVGSPADIAGAVRYFCEVGDYVTGQVLIVDGGRSVSAE